MATTDRPGVADFYEREVLPALVERLDQAFPEFGWQRDPRGWHATNQLFTHATLGVRADRVVCHGHAPRGFLVHGEGPVLWTSYANDGRAARGRDFIDVVGRLAERAGVDVAPIERPPTTAERKARLLHDAFVISRHELTSERGTAARAYLESRGIPADRIALATLGVIPPSDTLRQALNAQGYDRRELDASGLLADTRWPGSIVGAWRDPHGAAATLWIRTIDADADHRYLYLRGASRNAGIPYGLSDLLASSSPSARRQLTLVEGVMDVHVLRAHDIGSVAALGGTNVTPELFESLADHDVERVIVALDNDAAGRAALTRATDASVRAERSPGVWIIDPDLYGAGKDPADVVRNGGAHAWQAAAVAPVCAITWRALELTGPIATSRNQLARCAGLANASAWLATLPAHLSIEQANALDTVSKTLGYDRDAVRRAFRARHWRHDPVPETSRPTALER